MKVHTIIVTDSGIEQTVDIEDISRQEWDTSKGSTLSVNDLGCEAGQAYRVELHDEDSDQVIDFYDTTAD